MKKWSAGGTGCGELVVGLRRELAQLDAGERLEVVALDAGAPFDVPAWCRMTGYRLVSVAHPIYIIEK